MSIPLAQTHLSTIQPDASGDAFQSAEPAKEPPYFSREARLRARRNRARRDEGGEEFAEVVRAVLLLTDRLGPDLSSAERRRAAGHFATTARYEWMFWDMGHRREGWPVLSREAAPASRGIQR